MTSAARSRLGRCDACGTVASRAPLTESATMRGDRAHVREVVLADEHQCRAGDLADAFGDRGRRGRPPPRRPPPRRPPASRRSGAPSRAPSPGTPGRRPPARGRLRRSRCGGRLLPPARSRPPRRPSLPRPSPASRPTTPTRAGRERSRPAAPRDPAGAPQAPGRRGPRANSPRLQRARRARLRRPARARTAQAPDDGRRTRGDPVRSRGSRPPPARRPAAATCGCRRFPHGATRTVLTTSSRSCGFRLASKSSATGVRRAPT